ncbi:hypothetical protein V6N12_012781 [Hibiscus sabdariffa]|uniref:Uncharacterized protein n=1 Tax=Hibiscus sabdariffa TaxID=183260 RepID=A0ABR2EFE4_9ROSI
MIDVSLDLWLKNINLEAQVPKVRSWKLLKWKMVPLQSIQSVQKMLCPPSPSDGQLDCYYDECIQKISTGNPSLKPEYFEGWS